MEYENKEAKKLFRWFLLCSVIILVLSATVAMFAVRSYRVKENKAVTAMLGIVLKNDGSDTEESRQEKISECMRMLEHPHAYQKSHQKEIKEAEKILQSYGISEAEPVIAGTKTMERRILLGTLGGVLLAELAAGGLFFIYQKQGIRKIFRCQIRARYTHTDTCQNVVQKSDIRFSIDTKISASPCKSFSSINSCFLV